MSTLLRYIVALLFSSIMATLMVISYANEAYLLVCVGLILLVITLYVWLSKKAQSYRFLYPGMLCFFLFTIAPIFFTVLISFTNLGTGHFFSQDEAREIILSERNLAPDAKELSYSLYLIDSEYHLLTADAKAVISVSSLNREQVVPLKEQEASDLTKYKEQESLSLAQVFTLHEALKKIKFQYQGRDLFYHRVDKLIESTDRYSYDAQKNLIKDLQSGISYIANQERGLYLNIEENSSLLPGFYTFVGAKNYTDLFSKDDFKQTFMKVSVWTLIWAVSSVILTFSLGMSLAIFLNDKNLAGKSIYRNLLILPYSIPFFISVLVFKGMLSKDFGIINSALSTIGIGPIPWLEDALWAKVSCLLVNLWLGFPYMFLLTTGILQSIPQSVYEAAKIDGASKWQSFKSITFPMILSSITPLLIGSFAFNLGNFVGIYLLTGGGPAMMGTTTPAGETDILISYTYRLAFEGATGQMFGLASSIALFIFVIITILTLINFKLFNMNKSEGAN